MRSLLLACVLASSAHAAMAMAAEAGQAAPPFALPSATGDTVSLERLRGKVVYVDFWASWCAPCKRSFPWMNEMQQKYGPRGFTVIGINVDKKRADAERFLAAVPAQFTIAYDADGKTPSAYAVPGMPTAYLIDQAGRVVFVEQGFRDEHRHELEERIRSALGKGA